MLTFKTRLQSILVYRTSLLAALGLLLIFVLLLNPHSVRGQYTPHPPILITHDDNFTQYGFPGSGTLDDPYIIEGWEINSTLCPAINVTDPDGSSITKYFIIRNCYLWGNNSNPGVFLSNVATCLSIQGLQLENHTHGIRLENSANVSIVACTVINCDYGIFAKSCTACYFSLVDIRTCLNGINIEYGSKNRVEGVRIEASNFGVYAFSTFSNRLHDAQITAGQRAIFLWNARNCSIVNVTASAPFCVWLGYNCAKTVVTNCSLLPTSTGVYQSAGGEVTYIGNNITGGRNGFRIVSGSIVTQLVNNTCLINNTVSGIENYGIYISGTTNLRAGNITLYENVVQGGSEGLVLKHLDRVSLSNDTIMDAGLHGLVIDNCTRSQVAHCILIDSYIGVLINGSSSLLFYDNLFSNTNNVLSYGDCYNISWNTELASKPNIVGGPYSGGNYWNDYPNQGQQRCDANGDGIGDAAFTVNASAGWVDSYPLVVWVAITSPTNNSITTSSLVRVYWSTPISNSHILSFFCYANESFAGEFPPTTRNCSVDTGSGWWAIRVVMQHYVPSTYWRYNFTASTLVGVDLLPPSISILSPSNGSALPVDHPVIYWTASDDTRIDGFSVLVSNSTWSSGWMDVGRMSYIYVGWLTEGEYSATIRAVDAAGRFSSVIVSFFVDKTAPYLSILSPSPYATVGTSSVEVVWYAADTSPTFYELFLDGNLVFSGNDTTYTLTDLTDGWHILAVTATDAAGNAARTWIEFLVDTTPPELLILYPTQNAFLNTATITVAWTASDPLSGIAYYQISIDGGSWINVGSLTSYTVTLPDGLHTVTVRAYDNAGHVATACVSFTVDTVPPQVTISHPTEGSILSYNRVRIEWTVSDLDGIVSVQLRIDGGQWMDVTHTTNHTVTLADGQHEVAIRAIDSAGNVAVTSVSFSIDTVSPSVTITYPEEHAVLQTATVLVTWNVSDLNLDHVEVRVDEQLVFSGSGTGVLLHLEPGTHTIQVIAFDRAGNTAVDQVEFEVLGPRRDVVPVVLASLALVTALVAAIYAAYSRKALRLQ